MSEAQLTDKAVAAVADLTRRERKGEVTYIEHGGKRVPLLLLPTGDGGVEIAGVKDILDEYEPKPTHPESRAGTAKFKELDSFLAHVARFKDGDSVIWANPDRNAPTLTSVLDYHQAANIDGKERAGAIPRFGRHRGIYTFERSPEFQAWSLVWNGSADKSMTQTDFAKFIEARIVDVSDENVSDGAAAKLAKAAGLTFATPADLVTLSRGLKVHVKSAVNEAVDPGTGEATLNFTTEHMNATGEKLSTPRAFMIQIPVFRGGTEYLIVVWLRYKLPADPRDPMRWWLEGYRITETFDHAFNEACKSAAEKSGLPVYVGEPE